MDIGMDLQQRQQLTMTPQLQQALRLLQLSTMEFNQEMEAALADNPFLEATEPPAAPATHDAFVSGGSEITTAAPESAPEEPPLDTVDWGRPAADADAAQDWTDWSESPVSLHEALRNQLLVWPLDERQRLLTHLLIDELSDAGYLEASLSELLALLPQGSEVTLGELENALAIVQQLEPTGIGARTLQECLLLQLAEFPSATPGLAVAKRLLEHHCDLLARRQFPQLAHLLQCDESELHIARTLIRTLDPRPGRRYAPDDARYIVPDVIVAQSGKRWLARMNPAVQPAMRLNRSYAELAGRHTAPACTHMLREARWLLRSIEQRRDTIQRVANAIVQRQRVFFSHGDAAMRPMSLKDIAGEVDLHESTVCRVTNGKYMATPRGLFEFKYFFSRQLPARGGSCSALAVRALIRELIAAENSEQPLSDVQLAHLLNEQGFGLVRRTVTKYRTQMRVPSVELRRAARHR
ncbi:MAG: RNA polymerase factor sigma-54 [Rhodocyclaceae bacterium]|nr:RNA polymerase factor sigma-54 [Rhodocyclaceae bacterium]